MNKLSIEEMLYLLYSLSQSSEEGIVLKSAVKASISRDKKDLSKEELDKNTNSTFDSLLKEQFIEVSKSKKGQFAITDSGRKALIENLRETNYKFNTSKGEKVLNALLYCIQSVNLDKNFSSESINFMSYDVFLESFKKLYFAERKRQEVGGIVAIRKQEISQKFLQKHSISAEQFAEYFDKLKADKKIFTVAGKEDDLVHLAE